MKRLEDLSEIAQRQLGGLNASPVWFTKARLCASQKKDMPKRPAWHAVLAITAALVLCAGGLIWALDDPPVSVGPEATQNMISSHSAGDELPTEAPRVIADVPAGSITMRAGGSEGNTLFASMQGSSFPLIIVHGATYRMLVSPESVNGALFGDALGQVEEFTIEPALGTSGIISNAVNRGEAVYTISGLGGALVAARVEGVERVFQRVSYAGSAVIGSETLEDTLCQANDVQWISIDGLGTVGDTDDAQILMQTLLDYAAYQSTAMSGKTSMRIGLSNGLTLQLLVSDDAVSACGTWSCPEFFEAFYEAAGRGADGQNP